VPEHVHVHAPHELTDSHGGSSLPHERLLEIAAALLMSVATVGIAWSGYQAAKWGGIQAEHYAEANTARTRVNLAAGVAETQRSEDLLEFNSWLEATEAGDVGLADFYERNFSDEFRPAFEDWLADAPLENPDAIASPFDEPDYEPVAVDEAEKFNAEADDRIQDAHDATRNADEFVFATVFFAVVLFFSGMSLRFRWLPMRVTVLALATLFLVYGGVLVFTLPWA
jgi:hypothetical protein